MQFFVGLMAAAATVMPALAQESGPQPLPGVGGCERALPTYFLNPQDVQGMFGVDADAMAQLAVSSYSEDIARACADSRRMQEQWRKRVQSVCFAAAAGVDEPHPYIVGHWLVIEFHPDEYDRLRFRRALARAVARGSVGAMSYECQAGEEKRVP